MSSNQTDEIKKQNQFYSYSGSFIKKYWIGLIFLLLIILLLVILKYAQDKLNFPESKMVLNWFGIIVVCNLMITYAIIMIYQKVKNEQGFVGAPGYQGPVGDTGKSDFCGVCKEKQNIMEPDYELVAPPQPILPAEIVVENTKIKPKFISEFAA
jgi:uncharacterized membrane protein (DUF485 family)